MTHLQDSHESLVSLIRRAQLNSLNADEAQHEREHNHGRRADSDSKGNSKSKSKSKTETDGKNIKDKLKSKPIQSPKPEDNTIISQAFFFVPALPAASSSNLVLSPMYSGHLPAAYNLDAKSRDIIPDDAVSDAHLFFVSIVALLSRLYCRTRVQALLRFES